MPVYLLVDWLFVRAVDWLVAWSVGQSVWQGSYTTISPIGELAYIFSTHQVKICLRQSILVVGVNVVVDRPAGHTLVVALGQTADEDDPQNGAMRPSWRPHHVNPPLPKPKEYKAFFYLSHMVTFLLLTYLRIFVELCHFANNCKKLLHFYIKKSNCFFGLSEINMFKKYTY